MPYIQKDARPSIDELVQPLIDHLKNQPLEKQDGALNYTVTKILKALYLPRAMGVLGSIQA
jgi:hypothetical protein